MHALNHSHAASVGAGRSSPDLDVEPMKKPIGPMPPFRPIFPVDP